MAEEDPSSKSEKPTGKKLADAKRKGNIAQSTEVKNWAILIATALGLVFLMPMIATNVTWTNYKFLELPHNIPLDMISLKLMTKRLMVDLGIILAPLLAFLWIVALFITVVQVGWNVSAEPMKPDVSKFSLIKGLKKMFGTRALVEVLKGLVKIIVVGIIAYLLLAPKFEDLRLLPFIDVTELLRRMDSVALQVAFASILVMTIVAVLDYIYQKYEHTKKLKMSKQDVKDETKQTEGDPKVKQRIAQVRMQRAQMRMIAAVHKADVVITNPTHFAVALEYSMDDMAAPRLVAKGMDTLAMKIREVADENDVPIVENPPLARALYASVEIDEEIPSEHYAAVAEVIGYVFRLKGKLPSTPSESGVHQGNQQQSGGLQ